MRYLIRSASLILIGVTSAGASAQTKLQCADSGTSMRNVSTDANGGVFSTTNYMCSFNRAALAFNCQVSTSQVTGGIAQTTRVTFASVDDFVDQYTVTPHLHLAQKLEVRGPGGARDTTYSYDSRKRLIREDNVSTSAKTSLVWTEWDAAGRPTKGTWSSSTVPIVVPADSITYDDKAKTLRRMTGGEAAGQLDIEFYKNGNQVVTTATSNGRKFISTMTTLTSEKICR